MADKQQEIAAKGKRREAILMKWQTAAKAADAVIQNHKQLATALKVTQTELKSVKD